MSERGRMRFAAVCSVVIHLLVLFPWATGSRNELPGADAIPDPVVLNLVPPRPRANRQLVDVIRPSKVAPTDTNLISDADSLAADAELRRG